MSAVRGALRKPRTAGGTWSYRIELGVGPDGRRRQRQQGGFRTKREAQTALNDALGELQRGEFVSPSKQTLAEFTEA
jgi:hypothetical protein